MNGEEPRHNEEARRTTWTRSRSMKGSGEPEQRRAEQSLKERPPRMTSGCGVWHETWIQWTGNPTGPERFRGEAKGKARLCCAVLCHGDGHVCTLLQRRPFWVANLAATWDRLGCWYPAIRVGLTADLFLAGMVSSGETFFIYLYKSVQGWMHETDVTG